MIWYATPTTESSSFHYVVHVHSELPPLLSHHQVSPLDSLLPLNCILPSTSLSGSRFPQYTTSDDSFNSSRIPKRQKKRPSHFFKHRLSRSLLRFWFDSVNLVFSICTPAISPVMSLWWQLMREAWPACSCNLGWGGSTALRVLIRSHPHLITRGGGLGGKDKREQGGEQGSLWLGIKAHTH